MVFHSASYLVGNGRNLSLQSGMEESFPVPSRQHMQSFLLITRLCFGSVKPGLNYVAIDWSLS